MQLLTNPYINYIDTVDCWQKNKSTDFFCPEKPSRELVNQQYSIFYKYYQAIDLK